MTQEEKENVKSNPASNRFTKKEKDHPPSKIVIRRLPPTLTPEEFLEQVSPLPDHDFFYFVRADFSLGINAFTRAYINFITPEDVFLFRDKFDGYVFLDAKGGEYTAVVEFSPFPKVPKKKLKKPDSKCGTLEQDPDYKKFVDALQNPPEVASVSLDAIVEELEAKEARLAKAGSIKTSTPLLEYLKKKKEEKRYNYAKLRDERRRGGMRGRKDEDRDKNRKLSERDRRRDREKFRDKEREKRRDGATSRGDRLGNRENRDDDKHDSERDSKDDKFGSNEEGSSYKSQPVLVLKNKERDSTDKDFEKQPEKSSESWDSDRKHKTSSGKTYDSSRESGSRWKAGRDSRSGRDYRDRDKGGSFDDNYGKRYENTESKSDKYQPERDRLGRRFSDRDRDKGWNKYKDDGYHDKRGGRNFRDREKYSDSFKGAGDKREGDSYKTEGDSYRSKDESYNSRHREERTRDSIPRYRDDRRGGGGRYKEYKEGEKYKDYRDGERYKDCKDGERYKDYKEGEKKKFEKDREQDKERGEGRKPRSYQENREAMRTYSSKDDSKDKGKEDRFPSETKSELKVEAQSSDNYSQSSARNSQSEASTKEDRFDEDKRRKRRDRPERLLYVPRRALERQKQETSKTDAPKSSPTDDK